MIMVLDAIFNALEWLVSTFPSIPGMFELHSMTTFFDLVYKSSFFIPYSTLFTCLGIGFTFYSTKLTISVANWLIKKIPTIN